MSDLRDCTETPDELGFLEFFESEPVESEPQDGYWCYQYADSTGVGVRFSFNILEKSVQTVLTFNGQDIDTTVHEGAEELQLIEGTLQGRFDLGGEGRLELKLRPQISVRWSVLRTN